MKTPEGADTLVSTVLVPPTTADTALPLTSATRMAHCEMKDAAHDGKMLRVTVGVGLTLPDNDIESEIDRVTLHDCERDGEALADTDALRETGEGESEGESDRLDDTDADAVALPDADEDTDGEALGEAERESGDGLVVADGDTLAVTDAVVGM